MVLGFVLQRFGESGLNDQHTGGVKGPQRIGQVEAAEVVALRTRATGGRVTELVARPLINLFYPDLSGFIQPLAGEYAGRRSLLETIPFFTGYAVEIGHLIDIAERAGLEALGQVDLERRIHRNQELEGLSRMSFVIIQAVMKRLEERRRARLFAEMGSTMKLPRSGADRLGLEIIELADRERPPMIRIPEYLEKRAARAGG